jgi:hypothetical protein
MALWRPKDQCAITHIEHPIIGVYKGGGTCTIVCLTAKTKELGTSSSYSLMRMLIAIPTIRRDAITSATDGSVIDVNDRMWR